MHKYGFFQMVSNREMQVYHLIAQKSNGSNKCQYPKVQLKAQMYNENKIKFKQ